MGIIFNLETINEAYFGKTEDVKKIEVAIGKARQKYIGKKISFNIYTDKDIWAVGDAIKQAFNFNVVDFQLSPDTTRNACAYPVGCYLSGIIPYQKLTLKKDGSVELDNATKSVAAEIMCTTGLWSDPDFTDAEITAIILHEIGHVLEHLCSTPIAYFNLVLYVTDMTINVFSGNIFGLVGSVIFDPYIMSNLENFCKRNKFLGKLDDIAEGIDGIINFVINNILSILKLAMIPSFIIQNKSLINNFITKPASSIVKLGLAPFRKGKEFHADEFAATYGYGADLSSALLKMDLNTNNQFGTGIEKAISSIPVIGTLNNFMAIPSAILMAPISAHPISPKRINSIIADLEKELDRSNLSPAMKKEIEKDIAATKEVVKNYTTPKNDKDTLKLNRKWFAKRINYKAPKGLAASLTTSDKIDSMIESMIDYNDLSITYVSESKYREFLI